MVKNLVFLLKNEKEIETTKKNDKIIENHIIVQSLPRECKSELKKPENVKSTLTNLKKPMIYQKNLFLPSTWIKLADFHKVNQDFINKCGEKVVNEEFKQKFADLQKNPIMNFLDIHNKFLERRCAEKKCACFKANNKCFYSHKKFIGNSFKPTLLTPILEHVIYK